MTLLVKFRLPIEEEIEMILINETVNVSGEEEDPSVLIMVVDDLAPVETVVNAEGKYFSDVFYVVK